MLPTTISGILNIGFKGYEIAKVAKWNTQPSNK